MHIKMILLFSNFLPGQIYKPFIYNILLTNPHNFSTQVEPPTWALPTPWIPLTSTNRSRPPDQTTPCHQSTARQTHRRLSLTRVLESYPGNPLTRGDLIVLMGMSTLSQANQLRQERYILRKTWVYWALIKKCLNCVEIMDKMFKRTRQQT